MAQPEEARDPSMEEILASIRKIIAEDTGDAAPARPSHLAVVPDPTDEPDPESATAEATSAEEPAAETETAPEAAVDETAEPEGDAAEVDAAVAEEAATESLAAPDADEAPIADGAVADAWSQELDAAEPETTAEPAEEKTDAAQAAEAEKKRAADLEAITAAMMAGAGEDEHRPGGRLLSPQADRAVHSAFDQLASTILSDQARTLEDLVKDMMRPMLKHWLDDNLPVLVERLVREEIERVSRGRR
jgi:cell pole-organizing protein PopZ